MRKETGSLITAFKFLYQLDDVNREYFFIRCNERVTTGHKKLGKKLV